MRFLFSFFSPPHRFYVSLPPRRKDEDTQRSNFNRKIVNRKIVNITTHYQAALSQNLSQTALLLFDPPMESQPTSLHW